MLRIALRNKCYIERRLIAGCDFFLKLLCELPDSFSMDLLINGAMTMLQVQPRETQEE